MFTLRAFFFDILILKLTVMPNQSPEPKPGRVPHLLLGHCAPGLAQLFSLGHLHHTNYD